MSDLRATVLGLSNQQPLLARTFELEAVKSALVDLKSGGRGEVKTLVLEPGAGESPAAVALSTELKLQQERMQQWQERMGESWDSSLSLYPNILNLLLRSPKVLLS